MSEHILWETIKEQNEKNAVLERENRLLGERCNQLLKDKGDLIDKIADIKANCDLAIEGRVVKIMELEQENNKLLDVINNQDVKIADLEKENAELPSIAFQQGAEWYKKKADVKLTKAKKLLNEFMRIGKASDEDFEHDYSELIMETEQFLNSEVVK